MVSSTKGMCFGPYERAAQFRELLSAPAAVAARDELLKYGTGKQLLDQAKKLYQDEAAAIKNNYQAAAEQLVSLAQKNNVPPELADKLRNILDSAAVTDPQVSYDQTVAWLNEAKLATGGIAWNSTANLSATKERDASIGVALKDFIAAQKNAPNAYTNEIVQAPSDLPDESTVSGNSTITYFIEKTASGPALSADNTTEVDYNVMSELAYARKYCDSEAFRIAAEKDGVTVGEYCQELLLASVERPNDYTDAQYKAYIDNLRNDPDALAKADLALDRHQKQFLEAMRDSSRYSNLTIDHADGLDTGNVNTQVIVLNTGDGHAMIAVQGTNGTTTDWINDAKFASSERTEEELYLTKRIQSYLGEYSSYDIVGHSQGGRDAITVAAFLTDEEKAKLRNVLSLDGPGYSPAFIERYGTELDSISDKVINIRPEGAYVGAIFIPVGRIKYVPTKTTGVNLHDGRNWLIATDENGNPTGVYIEGQEKPITKLINDLTIYASERFSPEVLEEVLPTIIRLAANPDDPDQLEFSLQNIFDNLGNISISDAAMLLSMVGVIFGDAALALIDECGPYLDAAGLILTVLSIVPWPGAPICATLALIVSKIDKIVSIVETVGKVLSFVCEWYLEYKARAMKRERDAYISGHTEIRMDYSALNEAKNLLNHASMALRNAKNAGDSIWDHFAQKRVEEHTNIIEEILQTVWEVVTIYLNPVKARKWVLTNVSDAFEDLAIMSSLPYCNKGADAIHRVITAADSIATSVQEFSTNDNFCVDPGKLAQNAAAAQKYVDEIYNNMTEANAAITKAGTVWQGKDYESIRSTADLEISKILDELKGMEKAYASVEVLAENYSVLQSTAVQEFQFAGN